MQFRDLSKQYLRLKPQIDSAIQDVLHSSNFISGEPVKKLEKVLAGYVGVKHCITCANGTDALTIALKAWNIGKGDAVFVPDFTFFSSGECPAGVGATPIFVDVDSRTYNLDPEQLEIAVKKVLAEGILTPKVVVSVDLFGLPANYEQIKEICSKYNLLLLEDGAQGFGGELKNKKACSFGDISTTSFFPAKPLGCYGDGGAIFTDNDKWADLIRSFCVHGKDTSNPNDPNSKYNNIRLGFNSRLDSIQAAVLLQKFESFRTNELVDINQVAKWYNECFIVEEISDILLPCFGNDFYSSWAQYTVQLPSSVNRSELQRKLRTLGIPTNVYYMKPMHLQGAFLGTRSESADCPITERLCSTVLSLPIDPYKTKDEVAYVVSSIKEFLNNN